MHVQRCGDDKLAFAGVTDDCQKIDTSDLISGYVVFDTSRNAMMVLVKQGFVEYTPLSTSVIDSEWVCDYCESKNETRQMQCRSCGAPKR